MLPRQVVLEELKQKGKLCFIESFVQSLLIDHLTRSMFDFCVVTFSEENKSKMPS